jgi:hypothetical protein
VDGVCQCLSDIIGSRLVVNESSFVGISLSDYRGYYKNTGHGYLDIISDREFGLVSDLVSGLGGGYECKLERYSFGLWNCINIYVNDGRRRYRYINIDKMVDEWFMVDVCSFSGYSGDQYRCDQLDGLLDCLRYINEKK